MNTRKRWSSLAPWARWTVGIVVAVVVLNVGLTILRGIYGGPQGEPSSSYATSPEGIAGYAELLARNGHPVVPLRGSLDDVLPDDGVVVVLDPEAITPSEVTALADWAAAGGRLVIGGRPELWMEGLTRETPPTWSPAGVMNAQPLAEVPAMRNVSTIGGEGSGSWEDPGPALPVAGLAAQPARNLVAIMSIGSGSAVLLADTSVLHNRYLATHDNALFALNLAGPTGTPVYFAEGVHGYGTETGLMAIPFRWKLVLIGLGLAAAVWMIAVGRRVGPPEAEARDLPPPRRAYVEALTTTLARTKKPDEVVAPVRDAVRLRIARRVGLDGSADRRALEGAGRALGLTENEIRAVFAGEGTDVVAVGRALAKLGNERW